MGGNSCALGHLIFQNIVLDAKETCYLVFCVMFEENRGKFGSSKHNILPRFCQQFAILKENPEDEPYMKHRVLISLLVFLKNLMQGQVVI